VQKAVVARIECVKMRETPLKTH